MLWRRTDRASASPPGWLTSVEYAHRGLHGPGTPENSRTAFAEAIDRGMGIEVDIQKSADRRAVVFHDFDLDRLTGERGPVAERTADDLAQITLAGSAETIPSLRAVLDQVAGRVPLLIEIKTRARDRVAELCRAVRSDLASYTGPHAVIGFDPRVLAWFARHSAQTPRGLSYRAERGRGVALRLRRHLALWRARPHFLTHDLAGLPDPFARAQRTRGLPLVAWTATTAAQRERALVAADAVIVEAEGVHKPGAAP